VLQVLTCGTVFVLLFENQNLLVMKKIVVVLLALIGLFQLTSCKKNKDGHVSVQLTDDPFPAQFVAEVNVNITKVELRNADTEEYVTVFEGNGNYNVVDLNNGATAEVSASDIPAGTYDKARITWNGVTVKLSDGREFDFSAGANATAEAEIKPEFNLTANADESILIDLDLAESLDLAGNFVNDIITSVTQITGIAEFDPDFRVVPLSNTGDVEGTVQLIDQSVIAYATVKTDYDTDGDNQPDDVTTIADGQGHFVIKGLPAGTYEITAEAQDGTDYTAGTVTVVAGQTVQVNLFAEDN